MTRANQKEKERHHVERFLRTFCCGRDDDLAVESRNEPEPDVLVRGASLARFAGAGTDGVAVEVTEYHPAASGPGPFQRVAVASRWQDELLPAINAAKQVRPALQSVFARLDFHDPLLPRKRDHQAIAEDLVRAIEELVGRIPLGRPVEAFFLARDILAEPWMIAPRGTYLASEDFPLASQHFRMIHLECDPDRWWPDWQCPMIMTGPMAPSAKTFAHIFKDKAAKKYDTKGMPLWLLIVAEFTNDVESHIFPLDEGELAYLREQICATGFDFAASQFQQVWLFSEFMQRALPLYPC